MLYLIVAVLAVIFGWPWVCSVFPTTQAFGPVFAYSKTSDKIVALTFDDGPNPPHTEKLLEVLAKHRVVATFFVIGKNISGKEELLKQMVAAGHVVGNHAYSHNYWKYFFAADFSHEIARTQEIIRAATGQTPALYRSPWLYRTPWFVKSITKQGLQFISGTFGLEFEIFQPNAELLASRAASKTRPGTILIFHDGAGAGPGNRAQTVEAIDRLIPKLKNLGYRFETVDKLLQVAAYQN